MSVKLLDCTLRDGAYIVESMFGAPAIKGIIKHMQDANVDIIECGWLKDNPHKEGSSYYHVPADLEPYLLEKNPNTTYIVMIDWNRYNTDALPPYDGKSLEAVRVATNIWTVRLASKTERVYSISAVLRVSTVLLPIVWTNNYAAAYPSYGWKRSVKS